MSYRFGPFLLQPERLRLECRGEPMPLEPKVVELLARLLEEPGRLVGKQELLDEVWQGRFVSDGALSRAVGEARKAMAQGDSEARSWIRTVYGRGFVYEGPAVAAAKTETEADGGSRSDSPSLPAPLTDALSGAVTTGPLTVLS